MCITGRYGSAYCSSTGLILTILPLNMVIQDNVIHRIKVQATIDQNATSTYLEVTFHDYILDKHVTCISMK